MFVKSVKLCGNFILLSFRFYRRLIALFLYLLLGLGFAFTFPILSAHGTFDSPSPFISCPEKIKNSVRDCTSTLKLNHKPIHQHRLDNSRVSEASLALQLALQGQALYDAGKFENAEGLWLQAAKAYIQQECNPEGMLKSLINRSQALQSLGFYPKARNTLLQALTLYDRDCETINSLLENNPNLLDQSASLQQQTDLLQEELNGIVKSNPTALSPTQAIALNSLGNVLRRLGELESSQALLQLSLKVPDREAPSMAATQLDLANTERSLGNRERHRQNLVNVVLDVGLVAEVERREQVTLEFALGFYGGGYYQQALNLYEKAANPSATEISRTQAKLNRLSLLLDLRKNWTEAIVMALENNPRVLFYWPDLERDLTQQIQQLQWDLHHHLSNLPLTRTVMEAQLNFADLTIRYSTLSHLDRVATLLENTIQNARDRGDNRAEVYAMGYLGRLKERQAVESEDASQRNPLLLQAQNLTQQALQRSIATNANYQGILYQLQWQSGRILKALGETEAAKVAYEQALTTLTDDLRRDLANINLDVQFSFRDEVEPLYREFVGLLLQGDRRVSATDIEKARDTIESLQLAELNNFFQNPCSLIQQVDIDQFIDENAPTSAVVYPILVEDKQTKEIRIETILKLSDRTLRHYTTRLPQRQFEATLDALYQTLYVEAVSLLNTRVELSQRVEFLQSNQAQLLPLLQTVYGWLIAPIEADLEAIDTLVFVLDSRLQNIPMAALHDGNQYLVQSYNIALAPSLKLTDPEPLPRDNLNVLAAGISRDTQSNAPLLAVEEELAQIQTLLPDSTILLNEAFSQKTLQDRLDESFEIVHLASHAQFSSNPKETWILTYDDLIDINQLDGLLQSRGRSSSIPLLVLSSCETAKGDRRATLGLAGLAVRSGASSTLATLWSLEDTTAARFMGQFYAALTQLSDDPTLTKASVLRRAQLELLENSPYTHPAFWASYLLLGNWL